MARQFDDVGECVEATLARIGKRVVLGLPIGIGKPNPFVNELYRRAVRDPTLSLTILTGLSLQRPAAGSELERRLVEPLAERLFGTYPDLEYVLAAKRNALPDNVRIIEFFLEPGAYLGARRSQQDYLSANYTHVARDLAARGVNVIAHLVAKRSGESRLSLGSNPDVTVDLLPMIDAMRRDGHDVVTIGEVHAQMPFMLGHALVEADRFDFLLEHPRYDFDLFAPPNPPIGDVDHAIGLHASALLRDGGTIQIGIGELGDAIVYSTLLRHQQNASYRQALSDLGTERTAALLDASGGRAPFAAGLFAATEMFVDQLLDLYRAGILRRRVYDWLPLQKLLSTERMAERFDEQVLELLPTVGVGPRIDAESFERLREFGVFREGCRFDAGRIRSPEGNAIVADLADPLARRAIAAECLGRELKNGEVLHAGFFLGPRGFYAALRDLRESERRQFDMRGVGWLNQLYGDDMELRVLQRRHARFVNTTMMITLLGAAVSDGLADGRVVSGVGGQYNFVAMGHALPDARSILCVRATRTKDGEVQSNLVWQYAHCTIPRHLRDIVITEYGIADLRGRTDAEVIAALLDIADSRFQDALLAEAKGAGKIARDYEIPADRRSNLPERLHRAFAGHRRAGHFSEYPFGTDLTPEEIRLSRALRHLKSITKTRFDKLRAIARSFTRSVRESDLACLRRLGLDAPKSLEERILQRLVASALVATADS